MLIAVPTFALAKVYDGVPPKVTTSEPTTPLRAAVPVAVAAVVLSYTLLFPVRPVTVSTPAFRVYVTVALAVQPPVAVTVTEILYTPGAVVLAIVRTPVTVFKVIPVGKPVAA